MIRKKIMEQLWILCKSVEMLVDHEVRGDIFGDTLNITVRG